MATTVGKSSQASGVQLYNYIHQIGCGTFGQAWLVHSRSSGRRYVVKQIKITDISDKERDQIFNEVGILARCKHVNIIRYREAFVDHQAGSFNIVMEYADAGDLYERICQQREICEYFAEHVVINWLVQVTFAVQYLHVNNILHRDLKTQNIFLTSNNLVKLGDFGIARSLRCTQDLATTAIGTPYYLSPEICQRQPYNHKSDMWAIGCILYETCCLTHPFNASDFESLVLRILRAHYAPIPSCYSVQVNDLVTALLQGSPDQRPSAEQLLLMPSLQPYVENYTNWQSSVVWPLSRKKDSLPGSVSSASSSSGSSSARSSPNEEAVLSLPAAGSYVPDTKNHVEAEVVVVRHAHRPPGPSERLSPDSLENSRCMQEQSTGATSFSNRSTKHPQPDNSKPRQRSNSNAIVPANKDHRSRPIVRPNERYMARNKQRTAAQDKNPVIATPINVLANGESLFAADRKAMAQSALDRVSAGGKAAVPAVRRNPSILKRKKNSPACGQAVAQPECRSTNGNAQFNRAESKESLSEHVPALNGTRRSIQRGTLGDSHRSRSLEASPSPQSNRIAPLMRSPSSSQMKCESPSTQPRSVASSLIRQVFRNKFGRNRSDSEERKADQTKPASPLKCSSSRQHCIKSPAKFFARPSLSVASRREQPSADDPVIVREDQVPTSSRVRRQCRSIGEVNSVQPFCPVPSKPSRKLSLDSSGIGSSRSGSMLMEDAALGSVRQSSVVPVETAEGLEYGCVNDDSSSCIHHARVCNTHEYSEEISRQLSTCDSNTTDHQQSPLSRHFSVSSENSSSSAEPSDAQQARCIADVQDSCDLNEMTLCLSSAQLDTIDQVCQENRDQETAPCKSPLLTAGDVHGVSCCSLICAKCRHAQDASIVSCFWLNRLPTAGLAAAEFASRCSANAEALISFLTQRLGATIVQTTMAAINREWTSVEPTGSQRQLPPEVTAVLGASNIHLAALLIQAVQLLRAARPNSHFHS